MTSLGFGRSFGKRLTAFSRPEDGEGHRGGWSVSHFLAWAMASGRTLKGGFLEFSEFPSGERTVSVFASGGQDVNHLEERYGGRTPDILDNAYVILEYPGGRRAMLELCMFAEGGRNQEEVTAVGDRGKIEAHIPSKEIAVGGRGEPWFSPRVEKVPTPASPTKATTTGPPTWSTWTSGTPSSARVRCRCPSRTAYGRWRWEPPPNFP